MFDWTHIGASTKVKYKTKINCNGSQVNKGRLKILKIIRNSNCELTSTRIIWQAIAWSHQEETKVKPAFDLESFLKIVT